MGWKLYERVFYALTGLAGASVYGFIAGLTFPCFLVPRITGKRLITPQYSEKYPLERIGDPLKTRLESLIKLRVHLLDARDVCDNASF